MSDVFISYAREDRTRAQALAQALEARGLTVWWDREIPAGRQFDEVIEQQLDAARCAVVLWSSSSAVSKWVKAEAGEALQQDKLVPALLEAGLRLPLEFRRVQAVDLGSWQPGQPSPALEGFCNEVASAVARAATTMRTHTRARRATLPAPAPAPPEAGPVLTPDAPPAAPRVAPPHAPPTPAPTPAPPRNGNRWLWAGVAAAVVVIGVAMWAESDGGLGEGTAENVAGFDQPLRWRDYVLNFEGRLQWDGRANLGTLSYRALDSGSGRTAAEGTISAMLLPNTGARRIFHAQIPVPRGDSRTAGAHVHAVNLIFEPAGSGWILTGNCMALERPDLCWR